MRKFIFFSNEAVKVVVIFTCFVSLVAQIVIATTVIKHEHGLWALHEMLFELKNELQNLKLK